MTSCVGCGTQYMSFVSLLYKSYEKKCHKVKDFMAQRLNLGKSISQAVDIIHPYAR